MPDTFREAVKRADREAFPQGEPRTNEGYYEFHRTVLKALNAHPDQEGERCSTCKADLVMIPGVGRECPNCGVIDYSDSPDPAPSDRGEGR